MIRFNSVRGLWLLAIAALIVACTPLPVRSGHAVSTTSRSVQHQFAHDQSAQGQSVPGQSVQNQSAVQAAPVMRAAGEKALVPVAEPVATETMAVAVPIIAPVTAPMVTAPMTATAQPEQGDSGPSVAADVSRIPDAEPQLEPLARYGNHSPYTVLGENYTLLPSAQGYREQGVASWYGTKFHGARTSSGEPYDMYAMTAAHRTLPLPTYVRVTRKDTGKSVVVKVNDRGPFLKGRVIDLSYVAGRKLGLDRSGTAAVELEAIDPEQYRMAMATAAGGAPPAMAKSTPAAVVDSAMKVAMEGPQLYVQVGAFSLPESATATQKQLSSLVYAPVVIAEAVVNQRRFHRVQVGPFQTREDALQVSRIVRDAQMGEPIIVQR